MAFSKVREREPPETHRPDFELDHPDQKVRRGYVLLFIYVLLCLLISFACWLAAMIGQAWVLYTVNQSVFTTADNTNILQFTRTRGLWLECFQNSNSRTYTPPANISLVFGNCVSIGSSLSIATRNNIYLLSLRLAPQSLGIVAAILMLFIIITVIVFLIVWRCKLRICDKTYRAVLFWIIIATVLCNVVQFMTMVLFWADLCEERYNFNSGLLDVGADWRTAVITATKSTYGLFFFLAWVSIFVILICLLFLLCGATGCMTWMYSRCFLCCLCCCCCSSCCSCWCNLFFLCCRNCDIFHTHRHECVHRTRVHEKSLESYTIVHNVDTESHLKKVNKKHLTSLESDQIMIRGHETQNIEPAILYREDLKQTIEPHSNTKSIQQKDLSYIHFNKRSNLYDDTDRATLIDTNHRNHHTHFTQIYDDRHSHIIDNSSHRINDVNLQQEKTIYIKNKQPPSNELVYHKGDEILNDSRIRFFDDTNKNTQKTKIVETKHVDNPSTSRTIYISDTKVLNQHSTPDTPYTFTTEKINYGYKKDHEDSTNKTSYVHSTIDKSHNRNPYISETKFLNQSLTPDTAYTFTTEKINYGHKKDYEDSTNKTSYVHSTINKSHKRNDQDYIIRSMDD